jgi:hypothetical protein
MDLISTPIGLLTLWSLLAIFIISARVLPLGALSLPCLTAITSFIYFYLMPAISLANGIDEFLGMELPPLEWAHWLVFLYMAGAVAAFFVQADVLLVDPSVPRKDEPEMNLVAVKILWALAIAGVIAQIALGKLNLAGSEEYFIDNENMNELSFITQAYNMMVPLTLILLLRDNFKWRSLFVLAIVLVVFVQVGFRFRIMVMLSGVATSFLLVRHIKIRTSFAIAGCAAALLLVNLLGQIRRYGEGIDLSRLEDVSIGDFFGSFGGEAGAVFGTAYIAANPLPDLALFEPWTVAITRLVPSFIWHDKPTADYMRHFHSGMTAEGADKAGVAAPQQVEMLLQFGWFCPPFLAFLYFSIAVWLISRFHKLGREARIAGCALAPAYFGYYMQTRGYFFQIFADAMFMIGPLFLVHYWEKESKSAPGFRQVTNSWGR